ncbi:TPA: twin-arginine translocase subunit TatC [Candidatus Poribacteria bacterium]|nr:twin-arginine translocase subunit TatC [Candidatus Poribacteria bacterium]
MNEVNAIVKDEPRTFLEHLGELRTRLVISAFAVTIGTIISLIFNRRLFDLSDGLLTLPLRIRSTDIMVAILGFISRFYDSSFIDLAQLFLRSRTTETYMITLFSAAPMEKFTVVFKASFIVGVIIAAPIVLYELWAFVLPALKQNERRYFLPLFFITLFFFVIGAIFAFFIVAPVSIPVLASLLPSVQNQWRIEYYFSFVGWLVLAFGVSFELPVVMGFVSRVGILDAKVFKRKRKIAIVLVFVASALLTPTQDPFTLFLMAIPLLILYEVGIRFAVMLGSQRVSKFVG